MREAWSYFQLVTWSEFRVLGWEAVSLVTVVLAVYADARDYRGVADAVPVCPWQCHDSSAFLVPMLLRPPERSAVLATRDPAATATSL